MCDKYFDSLVSCVGYSLAKESWFDEIRKKFNLPDILPEMPILPHRKEVLKRLHQMYPDDLHIAKELIKEMENK